jgi:ABC-type multidrug transport system ATPase subunit
MNSFDILCGKFGTADVSYAMSYDRYGGVYCNLILQILFLAACLGAYEYGSADWLRRRVRFRDKDGTQRGPAATSDPEAAPASSELNNHNSTTTLGNNAGDRAGNPPTLQLFGVSKSFGGSVAVQDVSFDVSQDQVMALLGANGAGKTTTFNMIRGEIRPDTGQIYVEGVSVIDQPSKSRLHIGVCPQQDAVDNLTVRQTLEFYAAVKGLKHINANVDQVLGALNIASFSHHAVKALSGGTKRKLTVCIALLGNPRLLLLDEPSTGQDARAKRLLWRALQRVSKGRAILLTTHSMEEAETLADEAVIISGRVLASGSLKQLQDSHGGLYRVRGVRHDEIDKLDAEKHVKHTFKQLGIDLLEYWDSNGLIQFQLVHDRTMLGAILKIMEALTGNDACGGSSAPGSMGRERVLTDYTLTGPTLEEVFVNVMRKEKQEQ